VKATKADFERIMGQVLQEVKPPNFAPTRSPRGGCARGSPSLPRHRPARRLRRPQFRAAKPSGRVPPHGPTAVYGLATSAPDSTGLLPVFERTTTVGVFVFHVIPAAVRPVKLSIPVAEL
jgi:hypothetical protein